LPNVATQWNSGATRYQNWYQNWGHRARIPSALTTRPLSHTSLVVISPLKESDLLTHSL